MLQLTPSHLIHQPASCQRKHRLLRMAVSLSISISIDHFISSLLKLFSLIYSRRRIAVRGLPQPATALCHAGAAAAYVRSNPHSSHGKIQRHFESEPSHTLLFSYSPDVSADVRSGIPRWLPNWLPNSLRTSSILSSVDRSRCLLPSRCDAAGAC